MEKLTIIYTNWRRRDNLNEIVTNCLKQTLLPKIVVIDNAFSDNDNKFIIDNPLVEILKKDNSLKCWERWLVSLDYDSKYICIMDDDLSFSRDNILEDCYNYMENNLTVDCIGYQGVKLNYDKEYFKSEHHQAILKDVPVTIIKGRFMFIRKTSLNFDLKPDFTCDDIKISSTLKTKILSYVLCDGFYELFQGDESLSLKHYQHIQREYATKKYFRR